MFQLSTFRIGAKETILRTVDGVGGPRGGVAEAHGLGSFFGCHTIPVHSSVGELHGWLESTCDVRVAAETRRGVRMRAVDLRINVVLWGGRV